MTTNKYFEVKPSTQLYFFQKGIDVFYFIPDEFDYLYNIEINENGELIIKTM